MYPVSAAYRHAMRRQVRDQGYVRLQFGIFDASAPGDAAVTVPPGTWYSDASVLDGGESPVRVSYATFEGDRMRLDGTQRLLPESGAELAAQGFVSAALCGADGVFASPPMVSVAFGTVHSMAGLTLDFGDCVPAQITVRAYTAGALADTFVVTDALEPYYRGEFLLEDVDALEISFDRMRTPYTRARLNELRYGVGYTFGNDEIIELAEKHTASPLSLSLPTASLSFTELPIPRPLRRVGDVRDVCVTRQEYEGTEKLVVTYNVGFVELDGTEDVTFHDYGNGKRLFLDLSRSAFGQYSLEFSHGEVGDTPTIAGGLAASFNASALYRLQIIGIADTWTALGVTDTATAKTWLAAQKAAGTPVQIAYQLAAPEVYATDPLDFDNAAGPLTVMTDGEVEVTLTHRMLTPYTAWTIQYDSEGEYTGDFFNVEDYDRIKQNIEYLREYAYFLYGGFTLRGMVAVTVESYGYASTIDALDANLEAIAANTFRPPDMLPVKQWRGNQPPPGADDWNRIENTCLLLFEQFERQFACLPKLAFELKGSAF